MIFISTFYSECAFIKIFLEVGTQKKNINTNAQFRKSL